MLIPIRSGAADEDDDTPQEWSLLELNGGLIPPSAGPTGTAAGADTVTTTSGNRMELGSVRFSADGTPIMTLGSHELKGKVETLKQPFVVMRKKRKRDGNDTGAGASGAGDSSDMDMDAETASASVSYEVAGIVKKKMLFDNYPKSIMR